MNLIRVSEKAIACLTDLKVHRVANLTTSLSQITICALRNHSILITLSERVFHTSFYFHLNSIRYKSSIRIEFLEIKCIPLKSFIFIFIEIFSYIAQLYETKLLKYLRTIQGMPLPPELINMVYKINQY